MANIVANPWSLTSTDPATAAITSATLNADGTVTVVTTAALTFNLTGVPANWFTLINVTNALYNGFYALISGVSGGTSFVLKPQFVIPSGTAASASGTMAQVIYQAEIRVEDISWQNATAQGHQLDLRDRAGNPVWQATASGVGQQNRGKVFWISGLTPIIIQSGVVLLTVD